MSLEEPARASRPHLHGEPRRRKRRRPTDLYTLEARYAAGLDLWTGEPLHGEDRREWLRIQAEQEESERVRRLRRLSRQAS